MPDEDYEETPLYGGDTRPATVRWVGLPLTVACPLLMAVPMIVNLISTWRSRFVAFGLLAVVAVFLWSMLRYDHNALRILGTLAAHEVRHLLMRGSGRVPRPIRSRSD